MKTKTLVLLLAGALGSPSADAQTAPRKAEEQKIAADASPAIPIAEVAGRADEVGAFLRSLDEQLPASPQMKRIEQELPPLSERLADRFEQTQQTIGSRHALGTLDALMDFWRSSRGGLSAWLATVTERADWLEQQRAELAKLTATWARTRTGTGAPASSTDRWRDSWPCRVALRQRPSHASDPCAPHRPGPHGGRSVNP